MNIKTAIEKAIKGGWLPEQYRDVLIAPKIKEWARIQASEIVIMSEAFLDPLFWQALGKTMGWGYNFAWCFLKEKPVVPIDDAQSIKLGLQPDWLHQWHCFIDSLAKGKTPEQFFEDLK